MSVLRDGHRAERALNDGVATYHLTDGVDGFESREMAEADAQQENYRAREATDGNLWWGEGRRPTDRESVNRNQTGEWA